MAGEEGDAGRRRDSVEDSIPRGAKVPRVERRFGVSTGMVWLYLGISLLSGLFSAALTPLGSMLFSALYRPYNSYGHHDNIGGWILVAGLCLGVLSVGTLLYTVSLWGNYVTVSDQGMKFRYGGKLQQAAWRDILGYNQNETHLYIKTVRGEWEIPKEFAPMDELEAAVEQRVSYTI